MISTSVSRTFHFCPPMGIFRPRHAGVVVPFTWTPSDITSATILHYLEGDSVSTTATKIDTATDKGPGGRNYTAVTTARPTLITTELNGEPVMDFNGTTEFLSRSSTAYHPNQGSSWTRVIFFRPDTLPAGGGDNYRVISSFNTSLVTGNQGAFTFLASGSPIQYPWNCAFASSGFNPGVNVALTTNWQLWITVYNGGTFDANASYQSYRDNTSQTTARIAAGTGNSTVNEIGRYPGGSLWFNGKIAFDMLLSGQVDATEIDLLWQYCENHYGV